MKCDTGRLRMVEENEKAGDREILMSMDELNAKQKKEMRVSLHDNKSKAGKKKSCLCQTKSVN